MTGTLIVLAAVLLALAWFLWPSGGRRPHAADAELDQAERDVQEASDQDSVRDWGPGTGQKPLP